MQMLSQERKPKLQLALWSLMGRRSLKEGAELSRQTPPAFRTSLTVLCCLLCQPMGFSKVMDPHFQWNLLQGVASEYLFLGCTGSMGTVARDNNIWGVMWVSGRAAVEMEACTDAEVSCS